MKKAKLEQIAAEKARTVHDEKVKYLKFALDNIHYRIMCMYEWRSLWFDYILLCELEPELVESVLSNELNESNEVDYFGTDVLFDDTLDPMTNVFEMKDLTKQQQLRRVIKYGMKAEICVVDVVAPLFVKYFVCSNHFFYFACFDISRVIFDRKHY